MTMTSTSRTRRSRLLMLCLLALTLAACAGDQQGDATETSPALAAVRTMDIDDRSHVDGEVDYPDDPPLGGPHAAIWVNCGRYDQQVPNELAVHALEHGAVWITHPDDLDDDDIAALAAFAEGQTHVLVSRSTTVEGVIVTAWGAQLELEGPDDPALPAFIEAYAQGPQTPEPGAPCTGGVGQPVS